MPDAARTIRQTTFTALILNPFLSVEELLREILLDFGVVSKDAMKSGRLATASKHELVSTLHDFLLSLVPIHGSAVLIIDEAQHLSAEVLEEIRVLSNLETNDRSCCRWSSSASSTCSTCCTRPSCGSSISGSRFAAR